MGNDYGHDSDVVKQAIRAGLLIALIYAIIFALGHQSDKDSHPKPTPSATARR